MQMSNSPEKAFNDGEQKVTIAERDLLANKCRGDIGKTNVTPTFSSRGARVTS